MVSTCVVGDAANLVAAGAKVIVCGRSQAAADAVAAELVAAGGEAQGLACDLLVKAGKEEAFHQFRDTASPFAFLDSYVFVLTEQGETLVDPAFPTRTGREMLNFKDAVGFEPIRALLAKLQRADEAWVQFLWPKPGNVVPSRKLVYARKLTVNGEVMIVGCDFFLATPIWMKAERTGTWQRNQRG